MTITYSVSKAQSQSPALVRLTRRRGIATITKDDRPVVYMVSREKWETLLETMDLLANPTF